MKAIYLYYVYIVLVTWNLGQLTWVEVKQWTEGLFKFYTQTEPLKSDLIT